MLISHVVDFNTGYLFTFFWLSSYNSIYIKFTADYWKTSWFM